MSSHVATIAWQRGDAAFTGARYSRSHRWSFDGGAEVPASASPALVAAPWSDPTGVDPEEAFVAAISSCHLLWFLSIACERGFMVERYRDDAEGVLGKDASGRLAITRVTLRPRAEFSGERRPTDAEVDELHHAAHEKCFLANSVKSDVRCEPVR